MQIIAISIMGRDRPGIIAFLTRLFYEHGGNMLDSSMTILRGEFAMILLVEVPEDQIESMAQILMKQKGLYIDWRSVSPEEIESNRHPSIPTHILTLIGQDAPGLVWETTQLLANEGINITDLDTQMIASGQTPVYAMILEVHLSDHHDEEVLRYALQALGKRLGLETSLKPVGTAVL